MNKFVNKVKRTLKGNRGDIMQFIIILIIIAIIASQSLPGIMNGITDKGASSVDKIGDLDNALKPSPSAP